MIADRGFSLAETLIALALAFVATTGVLVLATSHLTLASTAPELIDLQQRARAALQVLVRDLEMAGGGATTGPRLGPLVRYFAPVLPRHVAVDGPAAARDDALTIVAVPFTRTHTTLAAPLAGGAAAAMMTAEVGCPLGVAGCGFATGDTALLFGGDGNFDVVAVTDVQAAQVALRWRLGVAGPSFATGDSLVQGDANTYYWDAAARQLRHHDVDRTDVPLIDNVVSFVVEYYGDTMPPRDPRPPAEAANCLYDIGGVRRPELNILGPAPFTLLRLPLDRFVDGPWCGTGGTGFDADLLRVRVIRIRLRLQTARAEFRAKAGHVVPGTSTRAVQDVPDLEIAFDVAPRNMGIVR